VHVGENLPSESFEQLAMPHFERLYNFACWLTHHRQEAEDLVQETYANALKGFSSFPPDTNFRAWIYRILRNAFLTSRSGLKATIPCRSILKAKRKPCPQTRKRQRTSCCSVQIASSCSMPGGTASRLSRDPAAVRGRKDVLPGNLCRSRHPDGYGDVAFIQCQKGATRQPTAAVCKKDELKW
jgi:RNA polymerase sigma factor (sigma-70 family)